MTQYGNAQRGWAPPKPAPVDLFVDQQGRPRFPYDQAPNNGGSRNETRPPGYQTVQEAEGEWYVIACINDYYKRRRS